MSIKEWFYAQEQGKVGPLDGQELKNAFLSGELKGDSLIWKRGMQNWVPFKTVNGYEKLAGLKQSKEPPSIPESNTGNDKDDAQVDEDVEWHYKKWNKNIGPVSLLELEKACRENIVNKKTLVRQDGEGEWSPLEETKISVQMLGPSMQWYYKEEEQEIGPITLYALKAKHKTSEVTDATLVRKEGSESWEPFSKQQLYKKIEAKEKNDELKLQVIGAAIFAGMLFLALIPSSDDKPRYSTAPTYSGSASGLTERERKLIYAEMAEAARIANQKASKAYPRLNSTGAQLGFTRLEDRINDDNDDRLAQKYGVSASELKNIYVKGAEKGW